LYPAILSECVAAEKWNPKFSCLSRVMQMYECGVLKVMYDVALAHGMKVHVLVYDGIMVNKLHANYLEARTAAIRKRTSFDLRVVEKIMPQVTVADLEAKYGQAPQAESEEEEVDEPPAKRARAAQHKYKTLEPLAEHLIAPEPVTIKGRACDGASVKYGMLFGAEPMTVTLVVNYTGDSELTVSNGDKSMSLEPKEGDMVEAARELQERELAGEFASEDRTTASC
jgi:predicted DNA-binding antitoxin AbrB/MazE fold protein